MSKRLTISQKPIGNEPTGDGEQLAGIAGVNDTVDRIFGDATVIDPIAVSGASGGDNRDNSGGQSAADSGTGDGGKRRRGRPRGSGGGARKGSQAASLDVNGVELALISIHGILAAVTKIPELEMDGKEANGLAVAIGNVTRHYDISATQKAVDWTNLMACVAMIYGTRLFTIRQRRVSENKEAPTPFKPAPVNGMQPQPDVFARQQ